MRSVKEIKKEISRVRKAMKMHEARAERARERLAELEAELAQAKRAKGKNNV